MKETISSLIFKLNQVYALLTKSENIFNDIEQDLKLPNAVGENISAQFTNLRKFAKSTERELLIIHSDLFKNDQLKLEYLKRGLPHENPIDKTKPE